MEPKRGGLLRMHDFFAMKREKLKRLKELRENNQNKINKVICKSCNQGMEYETLKQNLFVCPFCNQYLTMPAFQRIESIVDEDSFVEKSGRIRHRDPLKFPGYPEKKKRAEKQSGLPEAFVWGTAQLFREKIVIGVLDGTYLMGSMGSVVGERITCCMEHAAKKKMPCIIVSASGGARMQEGLYSLMQMAKTTAAVEKMAEKGSLFISVLTNPTTGGVSASFASLGDILIAEPRAQIGFAGPRVIQQTIKQALPEGFQQSESLLNQGFLDMIVERNDMRSKVGLLIQMHKKEYQYDR